MVKQLRIADEPVIEPVYMNIIAEPIWYHVNLINLMGQCMKFLPMQDTRRVNEHGLTHTRKNVVSITQILGPVCNS